MRLIEGDFLSPRGKIAIVAARFNELIVDKLIDGAYDSLKRHGVDADNIECARVPGAFEIPLVAQKMAQTGRYAGIIALGAIIRGSTPHFDYVASTSASGVATASLQTNVPMTLGILTTDTIEQAIERAGTKAGNKGAEAAISLIELINVVNRIED